MTVKFYGQRGQRGSGLNSRNLTWGLECHWCLKGELCHLGCLRNLNKQLLRVPVTQLIKSSNRKQLLKKGK